MWLMEANFLEATSNEMAVSQYFLLKTGTHLLSEHELSGGNGIIHIMHTATIVKRDKPYEMFIMIGST